MKPRVIYICPNLNVHHHRIIHALEKNFDVDFLSTQDGSNRRFLDESVVIYSPLSIDLGPFDFSKTTKFVGISMAFDINHEILDQKYTSTILTNLERSNVVIIDSENGRESLEKLGFQGQIEVIPYGCDQEVWKRTSKRNFSKIKFLSTRTWTEIHNNELLIEAIAHSPTLQQFKFSILTPGESLEASLREKYGPNVLRNVEFHEAKSALDLKVYSDYFTCYVSTSLSDGSSVSLLEALSAGMICIVSDFPSNAEWVSSKKNGFLFQNNSVDSLVNLLESLVTYDQVTLKAISESAIDTAFFRANWKSNSEKINTLLIRMIEGNND